jgi:hypothetical protein
MSDTHTAPQPQAADMAKAPGASDDGDGKKRNPRSRKPKPQRGKQIACRLDDEELEMAYVQWKAEQRVPPADSDVMIVALQEFLEREGYYKPKPKSSE